MIKTIYMGKICKYANIYSKDCTSSNCKEHIIRHVDENGVLKDYTMEELEQLVDKLGNDKDDKDKIRKVEAFNEALQSIRIRNAINKNRTKQRPIEEQVTDALNNTYDEYEEIKEA